MHESTSYLERYDIEVNLYICLSLGGLFTPENLIAQHEKRRGKGESKPLSRNNRQIISISVHEGA